MKLIHYYLYLVITLLFVVLSCGISPSRAAKDYCKCLQPLADVIDLQDTLKTQGLIDSLAAMTIVAEEVWNDANDCMDEKIKTYGLKATKPVFKSKTKRLIKDKCPQVYARAPKH